MKKTIILIILVCILYACNKQKSAVTSKINLDGKEISVLHFKKITDSVTVNFSDILDDIKLIKLETESGFNIGNGKWWVGKKSLIFFSYKLGLHQFSSTGKYIRQLAQIGNGPNEFYDLSLVFSIDGDFVYAKGRGKKNIIKFNLKTGNVECEIPVSKPGNVSDFIELKNSNLLIAPYPKFFTEGNNEIFLYEQDLKGNCIRTFKPSSVSQSMGVYPSFLSYFNNSILFKFNKNDTLFKFHNNKLDPCFIVDIGNPPGIKDIETGTVGYIYKYHSPNYYIIQQDEVGPVVDRKLPGGKVVQGHTGIIRFLIYDIKTKKAAYLITQKNRCTRNKHWLYYIPKNGNFVTGIDALSFMELADKIKSEPDFDIILKKEIQKIANGMTENDNPVLLIGKLKEEINF